jgi:hypothetical protein
MTYRIESTTLGTTVMFRMRCHLCGRIGIYHRDLAIAEDVAEKHERFAHGQKEAA